jgi:hypothetical protein
MAAPVQEIMDGSLYEVMHKYVIGRSLFDVLGGELMHGN